MMKRIQQTSSDVSRKAAVRGFALIGGLCGQYSRVGSDSDGAGEWCPSDRGENPAGIHPTFLATNAPTLAILEGHP